MTEPPYTPTYQDILDLLPIVDHRDWKVKPVTGRIRDENGSCPLAALCEEITGKRPINWFAEFWIGPTEDHAADRIMAAADAFEAGILDRHALLQALNIKPCPLKPAPFTCSSSQASLSKSPLTATMSNLVRKNPASIIGTRSL
jgi:hypothetical protein